MTPVEGDFERDFETPPGDIRLVVVGFPMGIGADCRSEAYFMIRLKKAQSEKNKDERRRKSRHSHV